MRSIPTATGGWGIVADETLDGEVNYAGVHQSIRYYAGITKSYSHQHVVDHFFSVWRQLFVTGEAQRIIESYAWSRPR